MNCNDGELDICTNLNNEMKDIEYKLLNNENIFCRYAPFSNKFIFSIGFLNKFNKSEKGLLLLHEYAHKRDRMIYLFLSLLILVSFSFLSIITLFYIIYYINPINLIIPIFIFGLSLIINIIFYRLLEYKADAYAAQYVNYYHLKTAFSKFKLENYSIIIKSLAFITHPKPEKRMKRLISQDIKPIKNII